MRVRYALLAALLTLPASYLAAEALLAMQREYGRGDLGSFLLWTLPFVPVVFVVTAIPWKENIFVAFILGALSGVAFTFLVRALLGPWMGAFSFSVGFAWCAGGAIACGAAFGVRRPSRRF